MGGLKPYSRQSIFGNGAAEKAASNIRQQLGEGFLVSRSVTRDLDAINSKTKVEDVVFSRDNTGKLELKVKAIEPKKVYWPPFFLRKIYHYFHPEKLQHKINVLVSAYIKFQKEYKVKHAQEMQITGLKTQIASKESQIADLQGQVKVIQDQLDPVQAKVDQYQALVAAYNLKNSQIKALEDLETELNSAFWGSASDIVAYADLSGKKAAAETLIGKNLTSYELRQVEFRDIKDQKNKIVLQIRPLREPIKAEKATAEKYKQDKAPLEDSIKTLQDEVADLKGQLAVLEPVLEVKPVEEDPVENAYNLAKGLGLTDDQAQFFSHLDEDKRELYQRILLQSQGLSSAPFATFIVALFNDKIQSYSEIKPGTFELILTPGSGICKFLEIETTIQVPQKVQMSFDNGVWQLHGDVTLRKYLTSISLDQMKIKYDNDKVYLNLHNTPGLVKGKVVKYEDGQEGMWAGSLWMPALAQDFIKWD